MRRIISLLLTLIIIVTCSSCGFKKAENKPYSITFQCFDTICSITIYDEKPKKDLEKIADKLEKKCIHYDSLYNLDDSRYSVEFHNSDGSFTYIEGVHFSNKKNAVRTIGFGEEDEPLYDSIKYSKMTDGAFDVTIAPLVKLWNINGKDFKIPSDKQIKKQLKYVDYKQIDDSPGNYYVLTKMGSIDFGGIAKGFISDLLVTELKENKIKSALIDLGGNIYTYGKKNNSLFKVGIKKPFTNNELSATVKAKDKAIITAGIYQRYHKKDGKIYSHIINPKTGYPINNDLNAVTVISDNGTAADALSTGFMVMGLKKGIALANKTKNIEAVFIDKDNNLHLTDGLKRDGKEITIK